MSSNQPPPPPSFNNWVKCSEGLIECGRAAAKIIKQVANEWHQSEIQPKDGEYKCKGKTDCSPELNNGIPNKPKPGRKYCKPCIKWADGVIPHQLLAKCPEPDKSYEVHWHLVKSADFYDNVVQVMKLFGLKKINSKSLTAVKDFDDFDPAWLLSMMEKVVLFCKGDVQSQVQKATEIRNAIMHRPVGKELPRDKMEENFKSYSELLICFSKHFPSILPEKDRQDTQARLDEIRNMTIVTSAMVQRTVIMFLEEVENWRIEQGADLQMIKESLEAVTGICKSVPELHDQLVYTKKKLEELSVRVDKIENEVESMKEQFNSMADQQGQKHQQSKDSGYSTSFSPSGSSPSETPTSNSSSFDTTKSRKQSDVPTKKVEYDVLMVHSEHDMDDKMYTDLIEFFDKYKISYISMHELPAGVNVFENFANMLEKCWWTMCLLSSKFLEDVWCDKRYVQACERTVRKQDESVFYVKEKGFADDDIPAGLKGISGLDHSSKFFKSVLRSTFKKLREQREERRGHQHKPSSSSSSERLQNGYQEGPQTIIQGSNNIVISAVENSNITIYQLPPGTQGPGGESANSVTTSQMGQKISSVPKLPTECTSLPSAVNCTEESTEKGNSQPDPSERDSNSSEPTSLKEPPYKHCVSIGDADVKDSVKSEPDPSGGDCNTRSTAQASLQEPPFKDLVSLENAGLKDDVTDKEPVSLGVKSPVAPLRLLEVQEDSIDSSGSLKKSLSSPDLLSIEKEESFGAPRSARLSSTSGDKTAFPYPFSGYSESFKPVYSKVETGQGTTGLKNLGNTCYMNTAIQCLSSATILSQYFIGGEYEGTRGNSDGHVAEEFAKVIKALWLGKYKSISPTDLHNVVFKHLPTYGGFQDKYRQHDVHEFLNSLIEDGLHKDVNLAPQTPKNAQDNSTPSEEERCRLSDDELSLIDWHAHTRGNQSIIVNLFQGQLRNVVECHGCQHKSSTFEVFNFLTLPIPSRKGDVQLSDCLEEFSKEEKLEGDNAYQCDRCKKKCSATKKEDIWRLPKILMVCLKRFTQKYVSGRVWVEKNSRLVKFPVSDLDVTKYTSKQKAAPSFDLFAVANHHGGSISGGHYTAFCQNACNKKWYKFDDNIVQEINLDQLQSTKAYLLFYTCLDMPPPV